MAKEATLLYAVPGNGFLELLDRFSASLSDNPGTHWLILPTDALVARARTVLSGKDNAFIHDQICTSHEFCLYLLSAWGDGITGITDSDARILLSRVIADHSKELPLFAQQRSPSGRMLSELQRLFTYIIRNGIVYPDCLENLRTKKSEQIGTILSAYTNRLKRLFLVTPDTLIPWTISCLEGKSASDLHSIFTHIFWLGTFSPALLEKNLVRECGKKAILMTYAAPYGTDHVIFSDDASFVFTGQEHVSEIIPASVQDRAKTAIFSDTITEEEINLLGESVSLAQWKDPVSELAGIAREALRLFHSGVVWEDIAIVFPDPGQALGYLNDVFSDYHITYHCSITPYLAASPLVSFYLLLGECIEKGYRYEELLRLVRSPYLCYRWDSEHDPGNTLDPEKKEHLLLYEDLDLICRTYGITGGYIDWEARFEQIIGYITGEDQTDRNGSSEEQTTPPHIPQRPLPARTIYLTLKGTLSLITLLRTLHTPNTLSEHCRLFRTMLNRIGSPVPGQTGAEPGGFSELLSDEKTALVAFDQVLTDLENQSKDEGEIIPFPEYLSRMRLLLMDRRMKEEASTGVLVTGIDDIGQMHVPYLFIASLNEGQIPRLSYRLPFINGSEAAKFGTSLNAHLRSERYRFISALLAGRNRVYLSSFKHRDERVVLDSPFLEQFYQGSFQSWGEDAKDPDPGSCSDSSGSYYSGVLMAREGWEEALSFLPATVLVSDIICRIGIERNYRFRLNRSEYDGIIGIDPAIQEEMLRQFGPPYLWSTALIESYARCPFRFYLEQILQIKPFPLLGSELFSDAKGSLVHSVLARFKRRMHEEKRFPLTRETYHDAVSAIQEIAREELDVVAYDTPVWLAKKRQLVGGERSGAGMFERYVAAEIARLAPDEEGIEPMIFVPHYIEYSFGTKPGPDDDPASVPHPVDLSAIACRRLNEQVDLPWTAEDIPDTLLFSGRINRVDLTNTRDFGVVDYKTGIKIPSTTEISIGKSLELPLYLLAFAEITGNNPVFGSYCHLYRSVTHAMSVYNPAYKTSLPRGKMPKSESKWEEILDNALFSTCNHIKSIQQGIFPIHADRGCSPDWFCQYKTICRFQPDRGSHLREWIPYVPQPVDEEDGNLLHCGGR